MLQWTLTNRDQSLFRLVGIRISAGPLYFAYGDEFVGAAETEGDD